MTCFNRNRWLALSRQASISGDANAWFDILAKHYAEPHRHYHTARHISECLNELDAVKDLADQPLAVELALWFHDAIYDTHLADNEEQSSRLAERCLENCGDPSLRTAVRDLVMVTKSHEESTHPDGPLLMDIDLSILGAPEKRFFEYDAQIRLEYEWVPETVFRSKRAGILDHFLKRNVIYRTERFRQSHEKQARENLRALLERLRA